MVRCASRRPCVDDQRRGGRAVLNHAVGILEIVFDREVQVGIDLRFSEAERGARLRSKAAEQAFRGLPVKAEREHRVACLGITVDVGLRIGQPANRADAQRWREVEQVTAFQCRRERIAVWIGADRADYAGSAVGVIQPAVDHLVQKEEVFLRISAVHTELASVLSQLY